MNIHRRDAETLRRTKSKSKPESAEMAEDAERWAVASGLSAQELPPLFRNRRGLFRALPTRAILKR
jgi:hypothetical protein